MTDGIPVDRAAGANRFFGQGVFILLPVLVLAVIGFLSIRQDKVIAERQAAAQARGIADEAADAIWAALTTPTPQAERDLVFTIDAADRLLLPPPPAPIPSPAPLTTNGWSADHLRLWETVDDASASPEKAAASCRQLLATAADPRLEAMVRFRLAGLLAASGGVPEARTLLASLSDLSTATKGETGLPLAPLARLKWIELTAPGDPARPLALALLCSNALAQPDTLTPFLLARAAALQEPDPRSSKKEAHDTWTAEWQRQELVRGLQAMAFPPRHDGSNSPPGWPRFICFDAEGAAGLLWRAERTRTNSLAATYVCRGTWVDRLIPRDEDPERARFQWAAWKIQVGSSNLPPALFVHLTNTTSDPFSAAVVAAQVRLPAYLGLTLDVSGRSLINSNHLRTVVSTGGAKGAGRHWTTTVSQVAPALLAEARHFDEGVEALRVGIHLVGPELLYERERTRSRLFGLLIFAATATSVIGFLSARRAYLRQQQLSEMKSNFVSSVSHELRAPLASVQLMAENLEHGKITEPGRQRDYFRFIVQECRRLGTLIENVLDFARIEQGRKQYDFEPTDVAALARRSVQLMEPVAAARKVTLSIDGPGPRDASERDGPAPLLDGSAILQALINLLDNAIKHAPAGSTVTVGIGFRPSTLTLAVDDDGPGIPKEEHEKIFHRFYRRGPELRRETQGVGIGLSIVKHITEAHGGRVRVESAPGQGSRFILELPLTQPVPLAAKPPRSPALHATSDSHH